MQDALKLFAVLETKTTEWILNSGEERAVSRNESIAVEGQKLNALVLVLDGLFAVRLGSEEKNPLTLLGAGELIGEVSFVEGLPASATVVACEDSRVLWVSRTSIHRQIERDPSFALDLYRSLAKIMSRRLRERSHMLAIGLGYQSGGGLPTSPEWLALAAALETFKDLLRRADAAAKHGEEEVPAIYSQELHRSFCQMSGTLTKLTSKVSDAIILEEASDALRRELIPYLHLTRVSRRVLVKPRGYAGDFLTIDWMYGNEPGGIAPLGPLIDAVFLDLPVSRAVRNRRVLLTEEITRVLDARDGATKVTSLACGPAAEIFDVIRKRPDSKLQTTLIDIDFQALAFVQERRDAAGLTKSMRLEHGNLVYLATGRRQVDLQSQNLVYSIGLIDYFEDRFVVALLNWIHTCLAPGGKVILGNFHPRNPDRAFMDLVLNWRLIHRTEEDMNRLFEASSFGRPCSEIRFEAEGINMFAACVIN